MAESRIDELRRRLERDPGSRLFAQLAEEHRKAGDHAEAIRVARAGLALHPVYPSARLTLGRALLDAGEPGAARDELAQTLREAPDNILASRFLGQALEALGDAAGAVRQYAATLKMTPGDRQLEAQIAALQARLSAGRPAAGRTAAPGMAGAVPRPASSPPAVAVTTPMARIASPPPPPLPPPPRPGPMATPLAGPAPPSPPPPPVTSSPAERPSAAAPSALRRDEEAVTPHRVSAAPARPDVTGDAPTQPRAAVPDAAAPSEGAVAVSASPADPSLSGGVPGPGEAAPLPTPTLAELYWRQGLSERALEVYRQVVAEDAGNDRARARLAELEADAAAAALVREERARRRAALERTIRGLEGLLLALGRR